MFQKIITARIAIASVKKYTRDDVTVKLSGQLVQDVLQTEKMRGS
jgi:hypothetical protein